MAAGAVRGLDGSKTGLYSVFAMPFESQERSSNQSTLPGHDRWASRSMRCRRRPVAALRHHSVSACNEAHVDTGSSSVHPTVCPRRSPYPHAASQVPLAASPSALGEPPSADGAPEGGRRGTHRQRMATLTWLPVRHFARLALVCRAGGAPLPGGRPLRGRPSADR